MFFNGNLQFEVEKTGTQSFVIGQITFFPTLPIQISKKKVAHLPNPEKRGTRVLLLNNVLTSENSCVICVLLLAPYCVCGVLSFKEVVSFTYQMCVGWDRRWVVAYPTPNEFFHWKSC